jgi:hypothetical protein
LEFPMVAWYSNWMLKSFKIPKNRLYNVQCWYADNACEIFQIVAYSETVAIERARALAYEKGYTMAPNYSDYVI